MLLVKKTQMLIQNAERYELLCESKRKKRENFTFDCSIKKVLFLIQHESLKS